MESGPTTGRFTVEVRLPGASLENQHAQHADDPESLSQIIHQHIEELTSMWLQGGAQHSNEGGEIGDQDLREHSACVLPPHLALHAARIEKNAVEHCMMQLRGQLDGQQIVSLENHDNVEKSLGNVIRNAFSEGIGNLYMRYTTNIEQEKKNFTSLKQEEAIIVNSQDTRSEVCCACIRNCVVDFLSVYRSNNIFMPKKDEVERFFNYESRLSGDACFLVTRTANNDCTSRIVVYAYFLLNEQTGAVILPNLLMEYQNIDRIPLMVLDLRSEAISSMSEERFQNYLIKKIDRDLIRNILKLADQDVKPVILK